MGAPPLKPCVLVRMHCAGVGVASGPDRAEQAAQSATAAPLIQRSIERATGADPLRVALLEPRARLRLPLGSLEGTSGAFGCTCITSTCKRAYCSLAACLLLVGCACIASSCKRACWLQVA